MILVTLGMLCVGRQHRTRLDSVLAATSKTSLPSNSPGQCYWVFTTITSPGYIISVLQIFADELS